MNAACEHLERIVTRAAELGVEPAYHSSGWLGSVARVVHMSGRVPVAMRSEVEGAAGSVRFYRSDGDPHTSPDEGLICEPCGVALSFPRAGA
jgi:hypothetical protein